MASRDHQAKLRSHYHLEGCEGHCPGETLVVREGWPGVQRGKAVRRDRVSLEDWL